MDVFTVDEQYTLFMYNLQLFKLNIITWKVLSSTGDVWQEYTLLSDYLSLHEIVFLL